MTQLLSRHACICVFNYACGENWQAAGCVKARMHKRVPRGIGSGKPSQGAAAGACVCILSCWGRGEAGAVCVCVFVFSAFSCAVMPPQTTPLIRADLRAGTQGTHATHSHDTCCLAHTHTFTVRGMRGFLSAVSHRHLQLHLYPPPPFSILIRIQKCFVKVRLYLNNCPIGMFSIAKISAAHILNCYISLIAKSIL